MRRGRRNERLLYRIWYPQPSGILIQNLKKALAELKQSAKDGKLFSHLRNAVQSLDDITNEA